jgi:hypothetical protein
VTESTGKPCQKDSEGDAIVFERQGESSSCRFKHLNQNIATNLLDMKRMFLVPHSLSSLDKQSVNSRSWGRKQTRISVKMGSGLSFRDILLHSRKTRRPPVCFSMAAWISLMGYEFLSWAGRGTIFSCFNHWSKGTESYNWRVCKK